MEEYQIGGGEKPVRGRVPWVVFIPGIALSALGALIIANPTLLVYIVGGGCMFAGIVLFSLALLIRTGGGLAGVLRQRPPGPLGPPDS